MQAKIVTSKRRVGHHLAALVADVERRLERGHTDARVEHTKQSEKPGARHAWSSSTSGLRGGHKGDKQVQKHRGTAHRWNWQAPGLEGQRWSGIHLEASGGAKYGAGNKRSVRTRFARFGSHLQAVKKCGVGIQYYLNPSPGREEANWEEIHRFGIRWELDLQLQSIGKCRIWADRWLWEDELFSKKTFVISRRRKESKRRRKACRFGFWGWRWK